MKSFSISTTHISHFFTHPTQLKVSHPSNLSQFIVVFKKYIKKAYKIMSGFNFGAPSAPNASLPAFGAQPR